MNSLVDEDEDNSPEWEKIRNFVGGANSAPKDPIQQELDRVQMREPENDSRGTILQGNPPTPPQTPGTPLPGASEDAFNQKASGIMGGVTPEKIQQLFDSLNKQANHSQIGAGIAGIGDAIASVGGQHPGYMKQAEDTINENRKLGLQIPGQMAQVGKERYGLAQELQSKDPASPFSKVTQNANRQLLKSMGASDEQVSSMPASAINDVVGHQVTLQEALARIKQEGTYQKGMLENTKAANEQTKQHQNAEEELAAQNQELQHPVQTAVKKFFGSSTPAAIPSGRVTVISPTGQVGHIPSDQLSAALKKGYKQQ